MFSLFLLVVRFLYAIILLLEVIFGTEDAKRCCLYFIGSLIHLVILPVGWKYPLQLQHWHAPIAYLSYFTYLINEPAVVAKSSSLSYLVGVMVFGYACAVLININWLLTSAAVNAGVVATFGYFTYGLNYKVGDYIVCFLGAMLVITFSAYFSEKRMKECFLQLKYN